ncbi:MAG TPA: DNA gyrase inhibitor YacG [Roseiarcus sp.]|nr:DNA gyrase inhibitor YacG [Roseiarcus sp.]
MKTIAANNDRGRARARQCPICGRPRSERHRPFCSRRCAEVDLHRWLKGAYVIGGRDDEKDRASDATARSEE